MEELSKLEGTSGGFPSSVTPGAATVDRENGGKTILHYSTDAMHAIHSQPVPANETVASHAKETAEKVMRARVRGCDGARVHFAVHFDDASLVPKQKAGEQAMRDAARGGGDCCLSNTISQDSNVSSSVSELGEVASGARPLTPGQRINVPNLSWNSIISNRTRKRDICDCVAAYCMITATGFGGVGSFVTIHGSSFIVDQSVLGVETDKDDISLACCTNVQGDLEVWIISRFRDLNAVPLVPCGNLKTQSRKAWKAKWMSCGTRLIITEDVMLESSVGEGEVRMVGVSVEANRNVTKELDGQHNTIQVAVLHSGDSDILPISLFSLKAFEHYSVVLIKKGEVCIDLFAFQNQILAFGMQPMALGRLLCVCGNDFIHGISVATPQKLIRTFFHNHELIGDLNSFQSIKVLIYSAFVANGKGVLPESTIREDASEFGNEEWIIAVRLLIFEKAMSADQVVPVDDDLDLFCKCVLLFNVEGYWLRARDLHVWLVQCDELVGFDEESWAPTLYGKESLKWRRSLMKKMKPECSCGASRKGNSVPEKPICGPKSRCSCKRAGLSCSPACKCSSVYCKNKVGNAMETESSTPSNAVAAGSEGDFVDLEGIDSDEEEAGSDEEENAEKEDEDEESSILQEATRRLLTSRIQSVSQISLTFGE